MTIELDIFFHTDETELNKKIGIDSDFQDYEVRKATFYNIACISPYITEEGDQYCSIHANGTEYISPTSYTDMRYLLNNYA